MSDTNDFWNRDVREFFKAPDQDGLSKHRTPAYIHGLSQSDKHPPVQFNRAGFTFVLFGIVVPICMITVELLSHVCAQTFFDPLPTFGHVLLVSLIPLSNTLFYFACHQDMSDNYAFMTLSSGMAVGVGIMYTLMLLPCMLSPLFFAFFFVLFSIPCSIRAGKGICSLADLRKTTFDPHQTEHFGHLIILVAVVALELPSTMTRIHLADAAKPDGEQSLQAIQWLRAHGNQDVMLRACYEHSGRATDIVGTLYESRNPIPVEAARNIFYRVTGKPFNSVAIPGDMRATMQHAGLIGDSLSSRMNADVTDEFDLDPDIAGETVSGVARGVTVSQAKISGKIDNALAVAELTMEFELQNKSEVDREARAKILLPAGAAVESAYIIADMQTRAAVIQPREEARAAYRASVEVKRDPLLISECGVDEVLMQCYPVKGRNKMFVSLHMVAPVMIDPVTKKATLALPTFAEKNFQANAPVDVQIEAAAPVSLMKTLGATTPPPSLIIAPSPVLNRILNPKLTLSDLSTTTPIISVERAGEPLTVVCQSGELRIINYACNPQYVHPAKLIIVVDGSAAMKPYLDQVVTGLRALPNGMQVTIKFVGDKNKTWTCGTLEHPASDKTFAEAMPFLSDPQNYAGGQDCSKMLESSLSDLNRTENAAILWIHAAQPIAPNHPSDFTQDKRIYDMQVCPGPDTVRDLMYGGLIRVATAGNVIDSLTSLFDRWNATPPDINQPSPVISSSDTAAHAWLEQLIAKSAIDGNMYMTDPTAALSAHVVTRLSSLVVSDEQPQMVASWLSSAKSNRGYFKKTAPGLAHFSQQPTLAQPASLPSQPWSILNGNRPATADMFSKAVGQLNSLSATTPASGFAQEKDRLYKDNGSITMADEPTSRNDGQMSYMQAPNNSRVALGIGSPSGAPVQDTMPPPQLQGAVNGTISAQGGEGNSQEMGVVPSNKAGHLGFDSWVPQQQQEMARDANEFASGGDSQITYSNIGRFLGTFFLLLIPMLMLAFGGIYYNKTNPKKNKK